MNLYVDPHNIISISFEDGLLYDKLTITFKNGSVKTIRKFIDVSWELKREYIKLIKEINKQ